MSVTKTSNKSFQKVEQAVGRPMLQWNKKRPIESIEYYGAQEKDVYGDKNAKDFNKLFWGDNIQVLSHLLHDYRGKIDLIYIDPPFDSKADYVKKVQLKGEKIAGRSQSLLEEKQYTDIWEKDEYLQFMYERLLIMKELLSDKGFIFLHCDWHKGSHLKLIMDEIFGDTEDIFVNEIIWRYFMGGKSKDFFAKKHDNIFVYRKSSKAKLKVETRERILTYKPTFIDENSEIKEYEAIEKTSGEKRTFFTSIVKEDDIWEISGVFNMASEYSSYPTQKPEALLERIIKASSNEGDLVLDCFMGSGTTMAVAQRLGRKWIGCDINQGAIQTTTKRINKIIEEQKKELFGTTKKTGNNFKGSLGFKILNVNDYDIFKNEIEAKEIIMDMYGVEALKRSYFDGVLDDKFVKVMPLNRVLNKMDIRSVIKNIEAKIDTFTVKTKSTKQNETVYEESVLMICSGMESDVFDYINKENKTGVSIDVIDIQVDKKDLVFKKKPEIKAEVKIKDKKLSINIKDFFSPMLMQKLELENSKTKEKAKVNDWRETADSVAIDIDYNEKLFNAEIMDLPDKREIVEGKYEWEYSKKGEYTVAIRVIDVLGEEGFNTFKVEVK